MNPRRTNNVQTTDKRKGHGTVYDTGSMLITLSELQIVDGTERLLVEDHGKE